MDRWASAPRARERFNVPRPIGAATPLLAVAVVAACVALAGSPRLPLAVAVGALLLAGVRASFSVHDRSHLRRRADALMQTGAQVHPQSQLLVWRAGELTAERNRRSLARSLRRMVQEVERPSPLSASPLNRRGVRPHLELVRALADRVGSLERPVAAQGMVLVEQLLTDGIGSPLYQGGRVGDLPAALDACIAALEPVDEPLADRRPDSRPRTSLRGRAPSRLPLSSGGGR
jgi:hypothetical protein